MNIYDYSNVFFHRPHPFSVVRFNEKTKISRPLSAMVFLKLNQSGHLLDGLFKRVHGSAAYLSKAHIEVYRGAYTSPANSSTRGMSRGFFFSGGIRKTNERPRNELTRGNGFQNITRPRRVHRRNVTTVSLPSFSTLLSTDRKQPIARGVGSGRGNSLHENPAGHERRRWMMQRTCYYLMER